MSLKILLIDENPLTAASLTNALEIIGHQAIGTLTSTDKIVHQVHQLAPDVVIIQTATLTPDVLQNLAVMDTHAPTATLLALCDERYSSDLQAIIDTGISHCINSEISAQQLPYLLELTRAQFRRFNIQRQQRDEAVHQLEERKLVDQAKAILIRHQQCGEQQAHQALRTLAMNRGEKLAQVAQRVVDMHQGNI